MVGSRHVGTPQVITSCQQIIGSIALLTSRSPGIEVHVLDLGTRKRRFYGTVTTALWATSFAGISWPIIDQRGIADVDLLADKPSIDWRELEPDWSRGDELAPVAISGLENARRSIGTTIDPVDQLATSGNHLARRTATGALLVSEGVDGGSAVEVAFIDEHWGFRVHGNLIVIWDAAGRFFVVDYNLGQIQTTGRAFV